MSATGSVCVYGIFNAGYFGWYFHFLCTLHERILISPYICQFVHNIIRKNFNEQFTTQKDHPNTELTSVLPCSS